MITMINKMTESIIQNSMKDYHLHTKSLKSASGYVGANRLHEVCNTIDEMNEETKL